MDPNDPTPDLQAAQTALDEATAARDATVAGLAARRIDLGRAYAAAVENVITTWVGLHALDRIMERYGERRGFAGGRRPEPVAHVQFAPDLPALIGDPVAASNAMVAELAALLDAAQDPVDRATARVNAAKRLEV